MDQTEISAVVEALLFASDEPLTVERLKEVFGEENIETTLLEALRWVQNKYSGPDSPVVVLEVAGGWQLATNPRYASWVKKLFKDRTSYKLSQAALETLAIISYRQPMTRAEVEEIRGVEVIAALETLLEKNLVKVTGRKETVGRPLLYGTTTEFLRQFGLKTLVDLPPLGTNQEPSPQDDASDAQPIVEATEPLASSHTSAN